MRFYHYTETLESNFKCKQWVSKLVWSGDKMLKCSSYYAVLGENFRLCIKIIFNSIQKQITCPLQIYAFNTIVKKVLPSKDFYYEYIKQCFH